MPGITDAAYENVATFAQRVMAIHLHDGDDSVAGGRAFGHAGLANAGHTDGGLSTISRHNDG